MQKFKKGDIVIYGESTDKPCYYINGEVIEHIAEGTGWSRDYAIPKDYVSIGTNKYWYAEDKDLTLVKPVVPEIEAGDIVEYLGSEAIVGCIHGEQAYASFYKSETFSFDNNSGGTCDEHKTFMGFPLDEMKLISKGSKLPYKKINVGIDTAYGKDEVIPCSPEVLLGTKRYIDFGYVGEFEGIEVYVNKDGVPVGQTFIKKVKTTMTNIKDFVKTSLLSKEEKLLRKHGFKQTECGEYTEAAKQFAIEALCKQQEAEMIRVATEMEEANKDSK